MDPTTQQLMMGAASGDTRGTVWQDVSPYLKNYNNETPTVFNDVIRVDAINIWIAVGSSNTIIRSTDGITWTNVTPASASTSTTINRAIVYSASLSQFIIASSTGLYLSTDNGVTWTSVYAGDFYDIEFAGSTYVAVGSARLGVRSSNGTSWTALTITSALAADANLIAVARSGTYWLIGGNLSSTGTARYAYVANADASGTWAASSATGTSTVLYDFDYSSTFDKFYFVGLATTSSTVSFINSYTGALAGSTTFTASTILESISIANSRPLFTGPSGIVVEATAATTYTTQVEARSGDINTKKIAYSSSLSRYVYVGSAGFVSRSFLLYSSAISRNNYSFVYCSVSLYTAAFQSGTYVFGGVAGLILTTTNFTTWVTKYLPVDVYLFAGVSDGTRVILAGGDVSSLNAYVYSSTDFSTWTLNYTATSGVFPRGIAYAPGGLFGTSYVITGIGTQVLVSNNGTSWSLSNAGFPSSINYRVTYKPGEYWIAVGSGNRIMYASDPTQTWTVVTIASSATGGLTRTLLDIVYSAKNDIFVVVTASTTAAYRILYSPSLLPNTWASVSAPSNTNGVTTTLNGATTVVCGDDNLIYTSQNGVSWTNNTPFSSTLDINDVLYFSRRLVTVGDSCNILISYR